MINNLVVLFVELNLNWNIMKRAIFPGTFDPFTIGHFSIVQRGLSFFDEIVIGIGSNQAKKTLFSVDKRLSIIQQAFKNEPMPFSPKRIIPS